MFLTSSSGVVRPLVAIFSMQSIIAMAAYALPVVIPVAAIDLSMDPQSVGFLVSVVYLVGMVTGLATGTLISHLGPTRVFQLLLLFVVVAVLLLLLQWTWIAVVVAVVLGFAAGPMNPTGSHVLATVTQPSNRAFVFSIKQCGTPAGGALAGMLLPPLMLSLGWQWAMLLIPALALVLIALAPFGGLGGRAQLAPVQTSNWRESLQPVREVLRAGPIRSLTVAGFALALAQMALGTYLVVFLWEEVGFSESVAGLAFAAMHVSGIVSRVILGFLTDRLASAKWVLVVICLVLAVALLLTAGFSSAWPVGLVFVVTAAAGASGNGWVGLFFSELARLSPPDRIAEVAGGSQFFAYLGLVLGPMAFGLLLKLTGSYALCFTTFAVIALASAAQLLRVDLRGR